MKYLCSLFLLLTYTLVQAQPNIPAKYGYRYFQILYKGDTVRILVKSRKGEEQKPKSLFFFCQGSLPVPLFCYDSTGSATQPIPFVADSLLVDYHLAVVGKPGIQVSMPIAQLQPDFTYIDSTGDFPHYYTARNHLDYYVQRNIAVIRYLQQQPFISKDRLVVAGHSEGSTITAKLAATFPKITHAIYSGGNPMGRITTVVARSRQRETDSLQYANADFDTWKRIVDNPSADLPAKGDSYKTSYDFSLPPIQYLEKLTIPVLISYGTKDAGVVSFCDYFHIDMIRRKKTNFYFKTYLGTEHNYFYLKPDGSLNYDIFNWDQVAIDWCHWLRSH